MIVAFDKLGWFSATIHLLDRHNGTVSAAATVAICFLTAGLLWTTDKQARLTRDALNLARAEFTAAHPPQVILREAVMDLEAVVAYTLANIGGSTAIIQESWIMAEYPAPLYTVRNLRSAGHDDLGRLTLAPGEIKDLTYTLSEELSYYLRFENADRLREGGAYKTPNNLHFAGAILFADNQGALRRTIFRRRWDGSMRMFMPSADPEHEYVE